MTRKCGFLDCNNSNKKGINVCENCQKRKENDIFFCSACRQTQTLKDEVKGSKDSFFYH